MKNGLKILIGLSVISMGASRVEAIEGPPPEMAVISFNKNTGKEFQNFGPRSLFLHYISKALLKSVQQQVVLFGDGAGSNLQKPGSLRLGEIGVGLEIEVEAGIKSFGIKGSGAFEAEFTQDGPK